MNKEEVKTLEQEIDGLLAQHDLALIEGNYVLAKQTMANLEFLLDKLAENVIRITTKIEQEAIVQ